MKIIHTADVHLGAKMDSKFPRSIASKRREELRDTFRLTVDYASKNGVEVIMLSGDVFDSDTPFQTDRDFFYSVVKNNPNIDFLYLRGNHDVNADYGGESISNLKTFTDKWKTYVYGNVAITGIEITAGNATSMYSTLSLDGSKTNIVMLHGQVGDAAGVDKIYLKRLRDKNINYLALGHVHKPQEDKLDDGADYAYCGCLEGRGFDEVGEHGFILLDVGKKVTHTFIPFAKRKIIEADADVTGVTEAYTASRKVKEAVNFQKQNIYRINLIGEISFDVPELCGDVQTYLSSECYFVDVKDRTGKKIDYSVYDGDTSVRGEFVRCVRDNPALSDEEKKQIISYGLKALAGGKME